MRCFLLVPFSKCSAMLLTAFSSRLSPMFNPRRAALDICKSKLIDRRALYGMYGNICNMKFRCTLHSSPTSSLKRLHCFWWKWKHCINHLPIAFLISPDRAGTHLLRKIPLFQFQSMHKLTPLMPGIKRAIAFRGCNARLPAICRY